MPQGPFARQKKNKLPYHPLLPENSYWFFRPFQGLIQRPSFHCSQSFLAVSLQPCPHAVLLVPLLQRQTRSLKTTWIWRFSLIGYKRRSSCRSPWIWGCSHGAYSVTADKKGGVESLQGSQLKNSSRRGHEQREFTGAWLQGAFALQSSRNHQERVVWSYTTCKDTGCCSICLWDREAAGLHCSVHKQGPCQQMALGNHKSICRMQAHSWSYCLQLCSNPSLI